MLRVQLQRAAMHTVEGIRIDRKAELLFVYCAMSPPAKVITCVRISALPIVPNYKHFYNFFNTIF